MKTEEITFKDLHKGQLESLKEMYIERRINAMKESELRQFVKDVLDLQIKSTVGNQEEKEVWKEMKDFFQDDFYKILEEIIKITNRDDNALEGEQEEQKKRLELLERRKTEEEHKIEDMW